MEEEELKKLLFTFWSKKFIIILIVLIFSIIGAIYSYFFITPKYKASTTLVLVQGSETTLVSKDKSITTTDVALNSTLITTYSELVKTDNILDEVATNLQIEHSKISKMKNDISVNAVNDTEILEITVKNEDSRLAADIANEIANVFCKKIVDIYKIDNIYLVDKAKVDSTPCNINHIKDIIVFALLGMVISIAYIIIVLFFDNTVKTEQDIDEVTNLTVLGMIPNYDVEAKCTKGGKKH